MMKATTTKGTSMLTLNAELRKANMSASELVAKLTAGGMQQSAAAFLTTMNSANRRLLTMADNIREVGRVMTQSFKFSLAYGVLEFFQEVFS